MNKLLFLILISLQGCISGRDLIQTKFPLNHIGHTSRTETTVDTMVTGGSKIIFLITKQTDTIWYEDSLKVFKMRRQLDSVVKATYLVTENMTRFQQKQQREYDFYKGVAVVTGTMVVVTGIWWILNGLQ